MDLDKFADVGLVLRIFGPTALEEQCRLQIAPYGCYKL